MEPTLDRHEIILVHNTLHDASFACVLHNKLAFSARLWNPMNQHFLCLPEVIGMLINQDR